MKVVRIFPPIETGSIEIDRAASFIHKVNPANYPFAFGYLLLYISRIPIHQVKVAPTVALRTPKHFLAIVQVVTVVLVIMDKGLRLLIGQMADTTVSCIYLAYDITLMPALIELKSESTAILAPTGQIQGELIGIRLYVQRDLPACFHIQQDRQANFNHIAGLGIVAPLKNRLALAFGAGLNKWDTAFLHATNLHSGQFTGVGRPDHIGTVKQVRRPVGCQGYFFFLLLLFFPGKTDIYVVVPDIGFPFIIG